MKQLRSTTGRAWVAGLMIALILLPGCTAWKTASPEVVLSETTDRPARVRVTLADSGQVVVWNAYLAGDSLRGYSRDPGDRHSGLAPDSPRSPLECRVSYALRDISRIEARRTDKLRTTVLVAGAVGVTVAAVWLWVAWNSWKIGGDWSMIGGW